MKAWARIDRFYIIFAAVLLPLAFLVVFSFKGIFSSIIAAYGVAQQVDDSELRIDKVKLEGAHKAVFEREIPSLEMAK